MSDLSEFQEQAKHLREQIELKNQTEALLLDPKFTKIILKGFCEDEMQRNMGLAVCETVTPDIRELCNNLAKASAALNNYLNTIITMGRYAEEALEEVETTIQELQMKEDAE